VTLRHFWPATFWLRAENGTGWASGENAHISAARFVEPLPAGKDFAGLPPPQLLTQSALMRRDAKARAACPRTTVALVPGLPHRFSRLAGGSA